MSIGVFDSGVGGLTVLKEIKKILPNEEIHYFGDTARMPYGEKTQKLIIGYSKEITEFLITKNVDAVVVACNTATSLALEELKKEYKIPIIGVIDAGVKTALDVTTGNKIGVIGTKATIRSGKYKEELEKQSKNIEVYEKECPLYAPVIEEGLTEGIIIDEITKMYLDEVSKKIDTLVLGCTHYPLIKMEIEKLYPHLKVVDPAKETASNLKILLENNNLLKNNFQETKYYVSDGKELFKKIGEVFLGEEINNVELVKL